MNRRLYLLAAIGAAAGVALAFHAVAQQPAANPLAQPPASEPRTGTVIVESSDGTIVEQTLDGKIIRTTTPRQEAPKFYGPYRTSDGRTVYSAHGTPPPDAETLRLATLEQAFAQEVRELTAQHAGAESDPARADAKKKLRDKLAAVFDLQQQRRGREISQIEERLAKLKETMKKRDASKDPIIDRRVEQLTGGVDELGWEESGGSPNAAAHFGYGPTVIGPYAVPLAPGVSPANVPAPVPVSPR